MDNMKKQGAIASSSQHIPRFKSNVEAALFWHKFGFDVLPIVPLLKHPAVKWDAWLDGLNAQKIETHWANNPSHELGFIVGDKNFVLDADSPESVEALQALEKESGVPPLMVVTTKRGEHHYYRRSTDTYAKSDAHSTEQYPERIDVKTGRAIVVLPPSTGKSIKDCWVESAEKLFTVEQDFIDLVFHHNGREVPRLPAERTISIDAHELGTNIHKRIAALLKFLNPEEGGHDDWAHTGMAIHKETDGDDAGLEIFDRWSIAGGTYPGRHKIEMKWRSFASNREDRYNIGTIINRVKATGHDWRAICAEAEDPFEPCEYTIINQVELTTSIQVATADQVNASICTDMPAGKSLVHKTTVICQAVGNALDRYTLCDQLEQIEALAVEQKPILGNFAIYGQSTVIFALPNVGKTAITMSEIINGINAGIINPSDLYYFNNDDTTTGLAEKLRIAKEYGFKMIAETFQDFQASDFLNILDELVEKGQARGKIIILDTLTKFVDVLHSTQARAFTKHIRKFVLQGGTLIALAHANKNPGTDGKTVYRGTTDIMNDFDCGYVLSQLQADTKEKVVEFENKKRRGNVALSVAYSYSNESGISYHELLASVKKVDPTTLDQLKQADALRSDAELIAVIQACITDGVNSKMLLADAAAKHAGVSKRSAVKIIERYTGDDPAIHKWSFAVRERGAKVFTLLDNTTPPASTVT